VHYAREYEYYPDGDWRYNPVADRWAMRLGRWVKGVAQHGHIVSVHNGPREPAFAQRFAADAGAIDVIMFQDCGTRDRQWGWLAAGIEGTVRSALRDWPGSAVFAEWGYERDPALPLVFPSHRYCDEEHTRRGAWRGAFCALGIIHGFEHSWGPFMLLEADQPGLAYLLHLRRFFTQVAAFHRLRQAPDVVAQGDYAAGQKPLALASPDGQLAAVYLPVGGAVGLKMPKPVGHYRARWFDPCTGDLAPAEAEGPRFVAPQVMRKGHPQDWVLVLESG